MKKTYLLATMLLALGISAFGQSQKSTPDDPAPAQSKRHSGKSDAKKSNNSGATKSEDGTTPLILAGTSLEAELQSMIDVRKSNVGDQVVLKTTKAIKQNGEVIVPKGANLVGRITEIKRKTKDDATSKVGMVFDRIQGKNLDLPVNASILTVTAARATASAGSLFDADVAGSGSSSGSASAGRTSSGGGGGLLGGVGSTGGGLLGSATSTAGGVLNTTTSTVGNVTGSAVNTVGGTTSTLGRTVNGLQISQSASGSANSSSTISAQGKDVRIDKGASFQMRLDGSARAQE
jgi:hypothetical protein